MYSYEFLVQILKEKGCVLLTRQEDYNQHKEPAFSRRIKIISKCGHISEKCILKTLIRRGTGILCRDCKMIELKHKLREANKSINGMNKVYMSEQQNFEYIKKILQDFFEIKQFSNKNNKIISIKQNDSDNDCWLPIRIYSSSSISEKLYVDASYTFKLKGIYTKIVIAMSIDDDKFWIFPDIPENKKCINIGAGDSKYNVYSVKKDNICFSLVQLYKEHLSTYLK